MTVPTVPTVPVTDRSRIKPLTDALEAVAFSVIGHGFIPGELHRYGPTESDAFRLPTSWVPVERVPAPESEPTASPGDIVSATLTGLRCGSCRTRVVLMPTVPGDARHCPRCGTSYPTYPEAADEMLEAA